MSFDLIKSNTCIDKNHFHQYANIKHDEIIPRETEIKLYEKDSKDLFQDHFLGGWLTPYRFKGNFTTGKDKCIIPKV